MKARHTSRRSGTAYFYTAMAENLVICEHRKEYDTICNAVEGQVITVKVVPLLN
jgi:hypothetical protein